MDGSSGVMGELGDDLPLVIPVGLEDDAKRHSRMVTAPRSSPVSASSMPGTRPSRPPTVAGALPDRLIHTAHRIELKDESMRR